ncbi:NAD(P)-binding protein [Annulohypoxylon stygium]|nr:NAD(P)-binding protein [Annulohypoxylon stygium]
MSGLTILSDSAVHRLLIGLTKQEILAFQTTLSKCLREFSVGKERQFQPAPGIVNRPNGQKTLFRLFTSPSGVGAKIIVDPAPTSGGTKLPLQGIVTLCDQNGLPKGVLNAGELTGYRTSLIAMIPYMWRRNTEHVVVYGSGKQALWHIRLALALRGDEIKSITVVNRSEARAKEMLDKIAEENAAHWKSAAAIMYLDPSSEGLENALRSADTIFCTVPSKEPLFLAKYVLGREQRKPYISAIGSWQPDMIELDPALVKSIVPKTQNGFHPEKDSSGVIMVDDQDSVLTHTGEGVKSELTINDIIEVGKLFHLREQEADPARKEELDKWLAEGLVVYKSVGVSVTDLAAAEEILKLGEDHDAGLRLSDF